jgi:hypothetical protein
VGKMKRVLLLRVFLLFFVVLKVNGQEVEVSSFSYLSSLLCSDSPQTILLSRSTSENRDTCTCFGCGNDYELLPSSRIVSRGQYGLIGIGLKAIKGSDIILDWKKEVWRI